MNEQHPALVASRNSWRCVQTHDKEGWLALMADDVCMEDPIGVAPTNKDGKGIRGKDAIGEFWDKNIGPSQIAIETHESHVAASDLECAHVMTLTTTLSNGVISKVRGIFAYRVNEAHQITNLRGFWAMDAMEFQQPAR